MKRKKEKKKKRRQNKLRDRFLDLSLERRSNIYCAKYAGRIW